MAASPSSPILHVEPPSPTRGFGLPSTSTTSSSSSPIGIPVVVIGGGGGGDGGRGGGTFMTSVSHHPEPPPPPSVVQQQQSGGGPLPPRSIRGIREGGSPRRSSLTISTHGGTGSSYGSSGLASPSSAVSPRTGSSGPRNVSPKSLGSTRNLSPSGASSGRLNKTNVQVMLLREAFDLFSIRDHGTRIIPVANVGDVLKALGTQASPEELVKIIETYDVDRDGRINFEEFQAMCAEKVGDKITRTAVKKAFDIFDIDGDNQISMAELTVVLKHLDGTFSRAEIEDLMHDLDTNGNGTVSFEEFEHFVIDPDEDD